MSENYLTEILPKNAAGHQAIRWTPGEFPGTGVLHIDQKRASVAYVVTTFDTSWHGVAVRLTKFEGEGGTDPEEPAYDVFCAANGQDCQCSCKGFAYGRGKPCKHILSVRSLIENGWLS
jgi:hypothetical protein